MFSPRLQTPTAVPSSDGPPVEAGLVVQVGLPSHRHFTALKQPVYVVRGERLTSHAPMVETFHRSWRQLCPASCPIGQQLMPLFRF